jgi:hypothetical protein
VQLYYKGEVEGEDELFGEPIKIKPIPEDVSDLMILERKCPLILQARSLSS